MGKFGSHLSMASIGGPYCTVLYIVFNMLKQTQHNYIKLILQTKEFYLESPQKKICLQNVITISAKSRKILHCVFLFIEK
jgi:hypothetical protein